MRIREAAKAAGVTPKTLGFPEGRGLLPVPERNANGHRPRRTIPEADPASCGAEQICSFP